MANWRFYGRESELETVDAVLDTPHFLAQSVLGRRWVGKSSLLAEVAGRRSAPPLVMCELPLPPYTAGHACARLTRAVEKAGALPLLDGLKERRPYVDDSMRFGDIVWHLLNRGAAVCLDEFHNARHLKLEADIKLLVDGLKREYARTERGKLFVMGSHQQQFLQMLRADQPLFGRFTAAARLRQWPVRTVLEMAAEHGLLSRPDRLLALWTAHGGIPRSWEGFVTASNGARLHGFDSLDGGAWRRAFLEAELRILDDPAERFDGRAYVELAPDLREAVLHLGRSPARGLRIGDLAAEIRPGGARELGEDLLTLKQHLELVIGAGEFLGRESEIRWRIDDMNSLFQLRVFRELFGTRQGTEGSPPDLKRSLARLETLEGETLERFAAAWIEEWPDTRWSRYGVWRAGLADIDVMAVTGEGADARLLLGGCKRDPEDHRPGWLRRQFTAFMDSLAAARGDDRDEAEWLRSLPQRHVAFSPEFTGPQRERLAEAGFECFGVRDMARECGIDPGPPAGAQQPEPDASSGLGM